MAATPDRPLASLSARVEQVSAGYAREFGIQRDDDWFVLKLAEEVGELTSAYLAATRRGWHWMTNLPTSWPKRSYWPITLISIWMQHYTANG